MRLLDEHLRPVGEGEPGEIVITGPGVGRYLGGDPGERFLLLAGAPAYRSGDLGVRRGGLLYYRGRIDSQVKRGGHRIEPLDIESNLRALAGVQTAGVLCTGQGAALRVTAFAVAPGMQPQALMRALRTRLPDYLLPDRILVVESIPLSGNGKTDYRALERMLNT